MKEKDLEKVYEMLYGCGWRLGNEDGSRYVVLEATSRALSPQEEQMTPWRDAANSDETHYWFYRGSREGELKAADPSDL
jgi:hypothetical protein